ncbi:MAG: hypothetical protein H6591_10060 [Flavobacteriales bacterium]|nr:hypothetical protein [Flavobacteriales bacterium]
MFRAHDSAYRGVQRLPEAEGAEAKHPLPEDHDRFCSVRVLIPGKRVPVFARMRWTGKDWLFGDGLRLSHANLVLGWSYL